MGLGDSHTVMHEQDHQPRPLEPVAQTRPGSGQWTPLLLLVPAICCGAPLLLAAAAALGLGTWLAANRPGRGVEARDGSGITDRLVRPLGVVVRHPLIERLLRHREARERPPRIEPMRSVR